MIAVGVCAVDMEALTHTAPQGDCVMAEGGDAEASVGGPPTQRRILAVHNSGAPRPWLRHLNSDGGGRVTSCP